MRYIVSLQNIGGLIRILTSQCILSICRKTKDVLNSTKPNCIHLQQSKGMKFCNEIDSVDAIALQFFFNDFQNLQKQYYIFMMA